MARQDLIFLLWGLVRDLGSWICAWHANGRVFLTGRDWSPLAATERRWMARHGPIWIDARPV